MDTSCVEGANFPLGVEDGCNMPRLMHALEMSLKIILKLIDYNLTKLTS